MPHSDLPPSDWPARLTALQAELADLAFALERRGRADAADVTRMISTRLDEILAEPTAVAVAGENPAGLSDFAGFER